ncbi:MAG: filamentous hemagglutinin N-terminal domain-containing protein, partial [Betaproteobacteria bacterium]|nr:filamentous hemagglutinin N-terminal domain-containing protein [Betaproteobacteria bacterium]
MSNKASRARSPRSANGVQTRAAAHDGSRRAAPHLNTLAHALLGAGFLSPLLIALPMPGHAQALPSGLQVMSGQASVSTQGAQMTVRNSPNAILNWRSFSVGAGQGVHFEQASAASKVLNRVTGGESSQIFGSLTSNGQV